MTPARNWPPAADTVITDPETGLPVLNESLDIDHVGTQCRGYCNQGRQPCTIPHVCHRRGTLHRIVDVLSHPDDATLRRQPLSQPHELRMDLDRRVLCEICGFLLLPISAVAAVAACYVIAECLAAGWLP